MKIDGPIVLKCADIYLRFPEIMEEVFDELIEFLNDNNIRYEGATKKYHQLKETYTSAKKILGQNQQLLSTLEEIREYIKEHKDYLEKAKEMYIDCENESLKISCIQLINNELVRSDNLLQIIDKGVKC